MSPAHEIHCYEYVNHPFDKVSEALVLGAVGVFQRATTSAAARASSLAAKLKVTIGGLEVGKNVLIKVVGVDQHAHAPKMADRATDVKLEWQAETSASLFPSMRATLRVYPLSPEETQLELVGTYAPPGGLVGDVADRLVGHRLADAAAHRFLEDLAGRMNLELSDYVAVR
ncbi:MAG TPA: hypothetical protein VGH28_33520 [Polyangiaceae bacterium]|jgi:FAD/FMN-containing dehydrogenase